MWSFGMVMDTVVFPATSAAVTAAAALLDIVMVTLDAGDLPGAALRAIPPRRRVDAGLALMLLNVLGATSLETWVTGLRSEYGSAAVVDGDHHPGIGDDHAAHAAQDACRLARRRRRWARSALDCAPARPGRAVADGRRS